MSESKPSVSTVQRSGFVAVAGRTNAGKSTLINQIVGRHVAIVSNVVQTTRRTVRAVYTRGDTQIVFVDLPGTQRPVDRMTERMQRSVEQGLGDVDAVVWVVDMSQKIGGGERFIAQLVCDTQLPIVIAANKVDRTRPADLIVRIQQLSDLIGGREYEALIPVSALTGEGCDELVAAITQRLPEGGAWYSPEQATDMRDDERICEYIREAALAYLRDELPHAMMVTVEEYEADDNDVMHVAATIWVERTSQIGMVVGAKGAMIRQIGSGARQRIETELSRPFMLNIRVKSKPSWRNDDTWLSRSGL